MGAGRQAKRCVKTFSDATGLRRGDAQQFLEAVAGSARQHGLSEGDTYRVASDAADMLATFGGRHDQVRGILQSGWEAGSMKTLAGHPMRQFAPLDGVLMVADAVCNQFFPSAWQEYVAADPERMIRLLQEEYAHLMVVPLSSEVDRIEAIRETLKKLGAEPDEELVREFRRREGVSPPPWER